MRRRLILSGVFPAALGWIMNMRTDGALRLELIGPFGPFPSANPTLAGAPARLRRESVSLISQSPSAPYESSSLATRGEACHCLK